MTDDEIRHHARMADIINDSRELLDELRAATATGDTSWFFCTYHDDICIKGTQRCSANDGTYGEHCTVIGPYCSEQEAEDAGIMEKLPKD